MKKWRGEHRSEKPSSRTGRREQLSPVEFHKRSPELLREHLSKPVISFRTLILSRAGVRPARDKINVQKLIAGFERCSRSSSGLRLWNPTGESCSRRPPRLLVFSLRCSPRHFFTRCHPLVRAPPHGGCKRRRGRFRAEQCGVKAVEGGGKRPEAGWNGGKRDANGPPRPRHCA